MKSSGCTPMPTIAAERYLIAGAVVQLGGARALVRRHGLGIFERASGFEIGGNAGRAEQVVADRRRYAGGCDVGVQRFGKRVMAWHQILLAAFLVQADQPAGPAGNRRIRTRTYGGVGGVAS
jgi:hypothetical protein